MFVIQNHPTVDEYNNYRPCWRIQIRCMCAGKKEKAGLLQLHIGAASCNMVLYPAK